MTISTAMPGSRTELKTPLQIGENFYGPREMHKALQRGACDLVMPDFLQRPYAIKDGHLHIPDLPGVGIEWNEDVVEEHRI